MKHNSSKKVNERSTSKVPEEAYNLVILYDTVYFIPMDLST